MDWLVPYYCAAVLSASRILMTSWVWPGPPRGTCGTGRLRDLRRAAPSTGTWGHPSREPVG
jgi:hypothetical protein